MIEALRLQLESRQALKNARIQARGAKEREIRENLAAVALRRDRTETRYGRLQSLHRDMRSTSADMHRRLARDSSSLTRISIRHVPDRAAADPRQTVDDLFQFLGMQAEPAHGRVLGCEPMLNYPGWQILFDFTDEFTKLETIVKFPRVRQHPRPDMRSLQLQDWTMTKHIFKRAKEEFRAMPEITFVGIKRNQVAYRRENDPHNYELETEADLEWVKSERSPRCSRSRGPSGSRPTRSTSTPEPERHGGVKHLRPKPGHTTLVLNKPVTTLREKRTLPRED